MTLLFSLFSCTASVPLHLLWSSLCRIRILFYTTHYGTVLYSPRPHYSCCRLKLPVQEESKSSIIRWVVRRWVRSYVHSFRCICFDHTSNAFGARVGVIGSLQVDEWIDKESGETRSKAKVIIREFDILESKAEADLQRFNQACNQRGGPSFY